MRPLDAKRQLVFARAAEGETGQGRRHAQPGQIEREERVRVHAPAEFQLADLLDGARAPPVTARPEARTAAATTSRRRTGACTSSVPFQQCAATATIARALELRGIGRVQGRVAVLQPGGARRLARRKHRRLGQRREKLLEGGFVAGTEDADHMSHDIARCSQRCAADFAEVDPSGA